MPALVREGEIFAGKYRVERILGEGGHGVVFAARNIELDERVAVKLLKGVGTDATTAQRFLREARAAIKIRGDGVARVYAVDQLDDGDLFMVMEYLEGRDLREEVVASGPLDIDDAVECILQACDVIGRAHAMGIIHRDLKSANLFAVARPDGRRHVKVLDFGIARSLDPVDQSLTQSPQMMGSPLYMAPEQVVDGRTVDERTDIWGLGATLFELLSGVPPFPGATIFQVLLRVQSHPHDDLRAIRPEVPPGLERVISRCLEKEREKRFPDVGSLVAALAPFSTLSTDATQSSAPGPAVGSLQKSEPQPPPPGSAPPPAHWTAPADTPTMAVVRPPSVPSHPPFAMPVLQFNAPHGPQSPYPQAVGATVVSPQDPALIRTRQPAHPVGIHDARPRPQPAASVPPRGASSPLFVIGALMILVLVVVAVVTKTRHNMPSAAEPPDNVAITETVPTVATLSSAASAAPRPSAADPPGARAAPDAPSPSAAPAIAASRAAAPARTHVPRVLATGGGKPGAATGTPPATTPAGATPLPNDRQ